MKSQITISGITVDIYCKKVKNINLRVYPVDGRVSLSYPRQLSSSVVHTFVRNRIHWIKEKLRERESTPDNPHLQYISGEEVRVWGKAFVLNVMERNEPQNVNFFNEHILEMLVRPERPHKKRERLLKEWYRTELKRKIPMLIEKWEPIMKVKVHEFGVKDMKTRWGTCNTRDHRIWLNLQLAKHSPLCLEFVVVHEMVHLLERLHSPRFYRLMDQFLPDWRKREELLTGKKARISID